MLPEVNKVLLAFDMPHAPPKSGDYDNYFKLKDWKDERDVYNALIKLNCETEPFGIFNNINLLVNKIQIWKPDLVFFLCESYINERLLAPHLLSTLELLGVKYTGASPSALRLCQDKGLSKKVLSFHNILVPKFEIFKKGRLPGIMRDFPFPCIVKPLEAEASEGISLLSLAKRAKTCKERVKFIHENLNCDAIIEEFISGREFYVGVLGNKRLTVFPPQELIFKRKSDEYTKFATFKAKWDKKYRKKWGINSEKARDLSYPLASKIEKVCKSIYRHFGLRGYARIDLRVTSKGDIYFLEANPNPAISRDDDFASAARNAGIPYEKLIENIIGLAIR